MSWGTSKRCEDGGSENTEDDDDSVAPPVAPRTDDSGVQPPEGLPDRYQVVGLLGVGAMGRVLQVHDGELRRDVAMKVVHGRASDAARSRFLAEAQATAQLEHPRIVPVYDVGWLDAHTTYYTMRIVRGDTLKTVFRTAHAQGHPSDDGAPIGLRRLVGLVGDTAHAIAYAHSRGVLHRDLKPSNIMVGDFDQTMVVDWGLAKVLGAVREPASAHPTPSVDTTRVADATNATVMGTITGTPAYMAPEQARGDIDSLGPPVDVFALGCILFEALTGRTPYQRANRLEQMAAVLDGPPPSAAEVTSQPLPPELVELCRQCLMHDPAERLANGSAVAAAIDSWMDGARRRAQAQELVDKADRLASDLADRRELTRRTAHQAQELFRSLAPNAPVVQKQEGWAAEDRAKTLHQQSEVLEAEVLTSLHAALRLAPDLGGAKRRLADLYHAKHLDRERSRDPAGAATVEVLLRAHDDDDRYAAYLSGRGTVTLVTEPAGADVQVFRYELENRLLVSRRKETLGKTPLAEIELPMGSYMLVLTHPECASVAYPVCIRRAGAWHGIPPGADAPQAVILPAAGELGPDDIYVPAGWFTFGGRHIPLEDTWLDAMVVQKFPVTNRQYIAFLDDLVATGRTDDALRCVPRQGRLHDSPMQYAFDGRRFSLVADDDGDVWCPEYPVVFVSWDSAVEYARWWSATTAQPWRLPTEVEWEKFARGVDGRRLPWGEHHDPSWSCVMQSHIGRPLPQVVDSFPTDVSVYGIRGVAGNVEQWCANLYDRSTPLRPGLTDGRRAIRGTHWSAGGTSAFFDVRKAMNGYQRSGSIGIRLIRNYES